jgi:hypothetical protein
MPRPRSNAFVPVQQKSALQEAMESLKQKHNLEGENTDPSGIVDIITFCEHPDLLNLPESNFVLFLSQRVVLKCLYIGSKGNENLALTEEEKQWLRDKKQENVIKSIEDRNKKKGTPQSFRISELVMVLGRRASKTVLASVIAAYEAYKVLKVGGGNPYDYYNIPHDEEIAIMNVATSRKQAGRLFANIKARVRNSKFFRSRVANVTSDEIRLYTDFDLKKKQDKTLTVPVEGSIVIVCGHSNPDSLRGYSIVCLIFDELAFYDESDKVSGTDFYEALSPSVSDFSWRGDGVIVEISTPGPKTGIFYKLWQKSFEIENMLSFKMATWEFNPKKPYDDPELVKYRKLDPAAFDIEFGAEWPEGGLYGIFFPEELVKRCVRMDLVPEETPTWGGEYYFHIDPAQSGDRYVMVAVRKTPYRDLETGKLRARIVLVFTRVFDPIQGIGLEWVKINNEVLRLCTHFIPTFVSYDQWNSAQSLEMLRGNGVNVKSTSFNRGYKNRIYQNLKELMSKPEPELWLYDEPLLITEMMNLKYKPTARGLSIGADKRSDCPTDDLCDCLAGAAFMASGNYHSKLPGILVAETGYR